MSAPIFVSHENWTIKTPFVTYYDLGFITNIQEKNIKDEIRQNYEIMNYFKNKDFKNKDFKNKDFKNKDSKIKGYFINKTRDSKIKDSKIKEYFINKTKDVN